MSSHMPPQNSRKSLAFILLGVAVWGLILAGGAALELREGPGGGDLRKFLLVAGTTAAFLTFWATALWLRSRRLRAAEKHRDANGKH